MSAHLIIRKRERAVAKILKEKAKRSRTLCHLAAKQILVFIQLDLCLKKFWF